MGSGIQTPEWKEQPALNQTDENKADSRRQLAGSAARLTCADLTGSDSDFILEGSWASLDIICEFPALSLDFQPL